MPRMIAPIMFLPSHFGVCLLTEAFPRRSSRKRCARPVAGGSQSDYWGSGRATPLVREGVVMAADAAPSSPIALLKDSWKECSSATAAESRDDKLNHWGAALTSYAVCERVQRRGQLDLRGRSGPSVPEAHGLDRPRTRTRRTDA